MMRLLILVLLATFIVTGCKKEKDCEDPGTGGYVTLVCFPQHHGDPIPGASVYIKFDADEFPGSNTALYEISANAATASDDFVSISGLKCGQYYIYSTGYDSTIFDAVKGGIPYFIEQKEGTININVPVTED